MDIAAMVILYHPDENAVENILTYSSFVKKLYIADNSETPARSVIEKIQNRVVNTDYIHDGENTGIAKRLNQVCKMALNDGYQFILTMDQDSSFQDAVIENYLRCFNNYPNKHEVSMFGVQFENPGWASSECNAVDWTTLITSGSIVNLPVFNRIDGFDENLFIDTVDFEYCFRSINNGYKVILFKNILLNHRLGIDAGKNSGVKKRSLHSPIRLYYMVRNYLYLKSKYETNFAVELARDREAILNRIKINLMHNQSKMEIIRFVFTAIFDFKRGRMGKHRKK